MLRLNKAEFIKFVKRRILSISESEAEPVDEKDIIDDKHQEVKKAANALEGKFFFEILVTSL